MWFCDNRLSIHVLVHVTVLPLLPGTPPPLFQPVGARECGFAATTSPYVYWFTQRSLIKVRALLPLVRESERVVARTKEGANEASLLVRERRRTKRVVARGATTKRDWKRDFKGQ